MGGGVDVDAILNDSERAACVALIGRLKERFPGYEIDPGFAEAAHRDDLPATITVFDGFTATDRGASVGFAPANPRTVALVNREPLSAEWGAAWAADEARRTICLVVHRRAPHR